MASPSTLLMLGGSAQQVVAIESAKRLGYRTVVCDYLPDNPGQHHADAYYCTSTTDRDAVLEVARAENVAGVLAYASDPAAMTAAYVSDELGLPGNPFESVSILSTKTLFREHLRRIGLPCPSFVAMPVDTPPKTMVEIVGGLRMPALLKPTDSSGSKGVTVLRSPRDAIAAARCASPYCRNGMLIVEEFIERDFCPNVAGDVFVVDGKIRFWGFMDCVRSKSTPLVPVLQVMPSTLPPDKMQATKDALQELVSSLDIRFGEFNVEVLIGRDGLPYILELGARAGGNMIPVQLSDASGIDLVRTNVECAMGADPGELAWEPNGECVVVYVLHSLVDGVYRGFSMSEAAKRACYRTVEYCERGGRVNAFEHAGNAIGIVFFRFDDERAMHEVIDDITANIVVDVS